jgi:hypothetical protein
VHAGWPLISFHTRQFGGPDLGSYTAVFTACATHGRAGMRAAAPIYHRMLAELNAEVPVAASGTGAGEDALAVVSVWRATVSIIQYRVST